MQTPRLFQALCWVLCLQASAMVLGCDQIQGIFGEPPVKVTCIFEKAKALAEGSLVIHKDVVVGEITEIRQGAEVEIDLAIEAEHAPLIKTQSFALIRNPQPHGPCVDLINLDKDGPSVKGGERIEGADSKLDEAAIRTKYMATVAIEATREGVKKAAKAIEDHGSKAVNAAAEAAAKGIERAKQAIENNEQTLKNAAETARKGITETQNALENARKQLQEDLQQP